MRDNIDKTGIDKELIESFSKSLRELNHWSGNPLNDLRQGAIKNFSKYGLPGKNSEAYKYTDIVKAFSHNYNLNLKPKDVDLDIDEIFRCDIPDINTQIVIVLNGRFFSKHNNKTKLPGGLIMESLIDAEKKYPEIIKEYLNKQAGKSDDSLVSLNSAFAQDGIFLYVPDNSRMNKPVQIINIVFGDEDIFVNQRNLFVLGKNASANVVICDHSLSAQRFLTNSLTEIYASEGSSFDCTRVQNEHNGATHITNDFILQKKDSLINVNTVTLHGGIIRNNMNVTLDGEGCENHNYGLSLIDSNQHIDNYTFIDHAKPGSVSFQNYKNVLDDNSSGAFNGRILVRPDAQKTSAFQKNNNILLTDIAKFYTKPQLEIYADDVKCSHGATSGQLDEDIMFYLRSRGISKEEARLMLMNAFASEIIDKIKVLPLRERINDLVTKRLRGELSKCNNCKIACQDIPWDQDFR